MPIPSNADAFASVLNRATQLPDTEQDAGKDLPDGFPLAAAAHHRVVDTANDPAAIEGMIAYDFTCRRGVFLIFRPWEGCNRCVQDMASNLVTVPATGDYTCPHTSLSSYEAIVNKTLAGEYLWGSENEVNQKDGSIVISLKWFEKKLNPKRKKRPSPADGPRAMQKDEPDL